MESFSKNGKTSKLGDYIWRAGELWITLYPFCPKNFAIIKK